MNQLRNLEYIASDIWHHIVRSKDSDMSYINSLRQRWVLRASQWMSGQNGSLQNHKLMFDYSDKEWSYIWATMSEDGAWDVPSIRNSDGVVIKENYGPEMLIRYIAHDLKCHILVFDLQLNSIQFCSGNYLKKNNTVCNYPLLLYSTGNHFQTVVTQTYQPFVDYVLKEEN